jgi:hypothetical protein
VPALPNRSITGIPQRPGTAVPGAVAAIFPRHGRSAAFTLLEVILALALSILVLAAIGFAVSSQLRFLDTGRQGVEEAQLARAILSCIADDLRNAVAYQSAQTSSTGAASSGSASSTSSGSATNSTTPATGETPEDTDVEGAVGEGTSAAGTGAAGAGTTGTAAADSSSATSTQSEDLSSTAPKDTPGLYGNAVQLEIDVSRLPRRDQLFSSQNNLNTGPQSALQYPLGDAKNVVYYLVNPGTAGSQSSAATDQRQGLFRRELDRTIALNAAQQGDQGTLLQGTEAMAPEVTAMQFRYFNGEQWVDYWDTSSMGALPAAVEIQLAFQRTPTSIRQTPKTSIYRLTVHLPAAQSSCQNASGASTDSTTGSTAGATTGSASGSSSGSSSSSSGSSAGSGGGR